MSDAQKFPLNSWLTGFLAAIVTRERVVPTEKTPVAYLYNGVRLPALPEWDKEKYPYAYITTADFDDGYRLFCVDGQKNVINGKLFLTILYPGDFYVLRDGEWAKYDHSNVAAPVVWCNTDTYYTTNIENGELAGTLYMAASDPVPVYE